MLFLTWRKCREAPRRTRIDSVTKFTRLQVCISTFKLGEGGEDKSISGYFKYYQTKASICKLIATDTMYDVDKKLNGNTYS